MLKEPSLIHPDSSYLLGAVFPTSPVKVLARFPAKARVTKLHSHPLQRDHGQRTPCFKRRLTIAAAAHHFWFTKIYQNSKKAFVSKHPNISFFVTSEFQTFKTSHPCWCSPQDLSPQICLVAESLHVPICGRNCICHNSWEISSPDLASSRQDLKHVTWALGGWMVTGWSLRHIFIIQFCNMMYLYLCLISIYYIYMLYVCNYI